MSPTGSRLSPIGNSRRRFSPMANAKRASMREGPLAALFRKTDEDSEDGPAASASPPAPPAHPRETGLPHPALSASAEAEPAQQETSTPVPTPRERLRHAFSSEIPEDVMDHSAVRPVMDGYARAHQSTEPGQVEQPVIRVVGVGGAGVNAVNRMVEAEVEGVEFLAINTDLQSLQQSTADITLP